MIRGEVVEYKCLVCGNVTDINDMVVLENKRIVCGECARALAGAMGYRKFLLTEKDEDLGKKLVAKSIMPKEIKAQLDRFVVGQDEAKKVLAVAAYNHYKRHALGDTSLQKSNVLMIGPTGSGKTYLMKTLAKIIDVPIAIASATNLTETGYVGDDVTSILELLVSAAGGDIKKAEKGIVFIDEIDKLTATASSSKQKVGGTGVQQALLPIIEGSKVLIQTGARERGKVEIDTSGILFVCGGAFPEIVEIVKKRVKQSDGRIGFGCALEETDDSDTEELMQLVTNDDLKEFGLIPEFLGRLPILAKLHDLSVETLKTILYQPEDSIVSQFKKLFQFDGIEIDFEDGALLSIAQKAKEAGTGARSLRKAMEELLLEVQFRAPGSGYEKIVVTEDFANGISEPDYSR